MDLAQRQAKLFEKGQGKREGVAAAVCIRLVIRFCQGVEVWGKPEAIGRRRRGGYFAGQAWAKTTCNAGCEKGLLRGTRVVLKKNGDHHLWSVHRVGQTVHDRRSLPHDRNISGDPGRMSLRSRKRHAERETKQASFDSCCITTRDSQGPGTTALRIRRCCDVCQHGIPKM